MSHQHNKTEFEELFGVPVSEVKKTCVLSPIPNKTLVDDLKIEIHSPGKRFQVGTAPLMTFLYTHLGAVNMGDAVLYLEKTSCENLILLGECGLLLGHTNLDVGSLVVAQRSLALESFCLTTSGEYLKGEAFLPFFVGDKKLIGPLTQCGKDIGVEIPPAVCASIGSNHRKHNHTSFYKKNHIEILDMECAAFYCAADYIRRPAAAVMYVSDLIQEIPSPIDSTHQQKISQAHHNTARILSKFTQL